MFRLKMLGIPTTALGFRAGFTGNYIEDYLQEKAIQTDFIEVPGMTRINVFTQVNQTEEEYKLVNQGPEIPPEKVQAFWIRSGIYRRRIIYVSQEVCHEA